MSNSNILKIGSLLNKFPNNGSKIELSQELKDALVGVWLAYGKSNDSTDRNIIKNKIKDKGGDFVISNAAYKLNSGYGKYEEDFTDWRIYPNIKVTDNVITINGNFNSTWFIYKHSSESKINEMNIKVSGIPKGGKILYFYISDETDNLPIKYTIPKDGIYHLPESKINNNRVSVGFTVESRYDWNNIRIEQIPSFEGAFVIDGKDDFITSTKTVQEMLGGSNEITVVSMIHLVQTPAASSEKAYTNQIRTGQNYLRNYVTDNGKTGIYGYTCKGNNVSVINNILGDKNDYTVENKSWNNLAKFSVIGYEDNGTINELDQVAWYWTIIANKVLTTDQINQVIAYFNLDRTLKSDIYCNIAKQGITNENHAEFGDKLIDFSGNGRDIQLNNIAWDGDSGIGKYNYPNWKVTATIANTYSTIVNYPTVNGTYSINVNGVSELMQSIGLHLEIKYTTSTGIIYNDIKQDGVYSYILPDGATDLTLRFGGIPGIVNEPCNITITQIPSHAGALCLDGVNDFGQFVGDLELKDYTFIADRAYSRIAPSQVPFIASTQTNGQAPFLMEYLNEDTYVYPHSFGTTTKTINLNIQRQISYQSTYVYNGNSISKGISVDTGDGLTIGNSGSTGAQYSPLCLWSLMLFPYSMSEFLIERQLKKHKLGTLYPDMVEFRPVINSNVLLDSKPTFVIRGTSTHLNAGDYVPENSQIWVSIKMNNIADRITKFTVNGKTIDIPENAYSEVTLQYGFPFVIDKSPQKIGITIEQDENYVLFNPVINSNYDNYKLTFHLREYEKLINIGDYIPKGTYIRANLYLKNNIDELVTFTFNGVNIDYVKSSVSDLAYNIRQIYNYNSPQEVNITIDEYIRYEDIVQPYPVLLRFNDENGNEVSWGGKFRVGSTITRIGSAADSNLLPNIYNIFGLLLNDNQVTSSKVIVEKTMVFKAKSAYIFDNNEPKCILSPSRLRIPNSSYKLLGYIPDISGHGNHGKINNSAYASMSGANGYPYDYNNSSFWCDSGLAKVVSGELIEYFAVKNSTGFSNITSGVYKGEIKVTGVTKAISENKISRLRIFTNSTTDKEIIDITQDGNYNIDIKGVGDANRVFFYAIPNNPNESIVVRLTEPIYIKQVGEYEGAYCLDGVDDFITIPTTVGGKQVLMKVNWNSYIGRGILYDQRGYLNEFAIYNRDLDSSDNHVFAYQARNNGQTYIDGILNNNIDVSELRNITHNITITNELSAGVNTSSPVIGSNRLHNDFFANMALYDFMLFDNISTDDKIKELNEYVGTEGNFVEWNPTITTNISSTYAITPNIRKSDGIIVKLVKGNIYSTSITGNLVLDIVLPNKDLDEVTNVIIDGKSYTPIKYQYVDYYRVEIPLVFPQEINITIDEYIRYESIEQPYPIFLNYIDKETNKTYTWGDKVKVDSILKISGYKNLFENGDTSLGGSNGYSVNGSSELIALGTLLTSEILVNKINTGVRSSVIWNLNTPKPLFAYDPSIINNVGLKNLGYLPDITGQGRHLLLNEFAYEGMSGINGYPVVLGVNKTWEIVSGTANYTSYITSNNIHVTHVERANNGLLYSYVKLNGELTNIKEIPSFKVNIKGLEGNSRVRYYYLATENATSNSVLNLKNGINEISKSFIPTDTLLNNSNNVWIGFSISAISDEVNSFDCDITIEILPNYEGTLCFDGINDYGIVSNLPSQYIKTLLMKVNWMKDTPMLLYDQRGGNYFGILTTQESDINNTKIAYQARNPNGKTYIDGIENNYIETYTLKDITHNITITNSNVNTIVTPVIGSNSGHSANFAQMAMYKVMGLPEIPSDEEIKTINNWAGIEAKVELPSYYWDAYGKTNLDADRGYIKDQVSLQLNNDNTNNNSLENFNFDYEGMSGYNGYPAVFGTNKTYANLVPNDGNFILTSSHNIINVTKFDTSYGLLYSHIKLDGKLTSRNIDYPSYKIKVTGLGENFGLHYSYLESSSDTTVKGFEINNDGIYIIPKSFASDGSLTSNSDWIGFIFTGTAPESCNVTIEVLPEYENGLAYDGVSDFSQNTEIEVVEDFTFLVKGSLLKGLTGSGGCIARKGDKKHYDTGGYAFIYCFDSPIESYRNSYYSFGKSFVPSKEIVAPPLIGYMTKTNVNGETTTFGTNSDIKGIIFGNWSSGYMNMVIYKSIFYTKTISLLEINFLKNLMEKDEIINLNNPIFIQK